VPELPEVETTCRGVEPYLAKHIIESVTVHCGRLRWPVSDEIYKLRGELVLSVSRRAKYLIVELHHGALLIHLGMSGSLRLTPPSLPLKKHDHLVFSLSNDKQLRFNDPRRFGSVLWTDDWTSHSLIRSLGPEPLEDDFNSDYLYQRAAGRKASIKQFLMDASIVVGVGNIYANEALFLAGISPKRSAGKISLQRMGVLVKQIKKVLESAIKQGGTTLRDFVNSNGEPGYFKQQLFVYGRKGMPCKCCGGALKEIRQNQRSTVYCMTCQK
jgi:formamidopyrimidine-DNA glycosylase